MTTLLEELRARRIVCPSLPAIERLAGSVRARAQRQLWRRLAEGLTDQRFNLKDVLPASLISFGVIAEVCRIEAQLLGNKGA